MEHKIGLYIDEACGLDARINLDDVEEIAKDEFDIVVSKRLADAMSEEGANEIKADIDGEGLNTIVICGSSPREVSPYLEFPGCLVERVNLREQVLWTHDPEFLAEELEEDEDEVEENITMMAQDYVRMGIKHALGCDLPDPYKVESPKRILVIGGGIAGMSAALNAAKAGYEAVIVEKTDALGGWATKLHRDLPKTATFEALPEPNVKAMIDEVNAHAKIQVILGQTVAQTAGQPGEFSVTLSGGDTLEVGSVVLAAGWKPVDTAKLAEKYQYGENPNVITSIELEEMLNKEGKLIRPSDGQDATTIAFVTNVELSEGDMTPYVGNVADVIALKQAYYLKQNGGYGTPYLIHDQVKAAGLYEDLYREVQKAGLVLVRGQLNSIGQGDERPLMLEGEDKLLGTPVMMEADLVVLSVGMEPIAKHENLINLKYRQGPELPELTHGYPNSHFICFPYETRRTGVYTCGTVREPMSMSRCVDDGAGAALKAIQICEHVTQGKGVHPRVGDLSFPKINFNRCTQCKRCTEECPFGAYDEDEKGTPKPNPTRCRRCGVCMGACPERIISFHNYSVGQIGNMLKSIHVPDEFDEKPRVLVFVCENDAYPALDMAAQNKLNYSSYVRIIPLRCLGSVNLVWVADALSIGVDGILMLGCRHGDDYQCHFIKGSELCATRLSKVSETLDRLMLESERVRFEEVSISDYKRVPEIINGFVERIKELDPNPYKE